MVPMLKEAAATNPKVREFLITTGMANGEELQAIALVHASKMSVSKPPIAPLNLTACDA